MLSRFRLLTLLLTVVQAASLAAVSAQFCPFEPKVKSKGWVVPRTSQSKTHGQQSHIANGLRITVVTPTKSFIVLPESNPRSQKYQVLLLQLIEKDERTIGYRGEITPVVLSSNGRWVAAAKVNRVIWLDMNCDGKFETFSWCWPQDLSAPPCAMNLKK